MKRIMTLITGLLLLPAMAGATPGPSTAIQQMNQIPLAFTRNIGQWDERVLFRATAGGATLWFTREGITYQFLKRIPKSDSKERMAARLNGTHDLAGLGSFDKFDREPDSVQQLLLTAKFIGAKANPRVIAEGQMEYKCNYFIGNDPAKWHADVPNYSSITLIDIYPGVDLKYSGDGNGQVAYEFIATPGAGIAQIKVEYEGAEETSIDADGRVVLTTKWGDMTPAIMPPTNGDLSGNVTLLQLSKKTTEFEADGANQQASGTKAVGLVYSTFLGGSGYDYCFGIAVDGSGCAYLTGYTQYSTDFPMHNAYDSSYNSVDVFVTKLSATGNSLIYSTYLGGGDFDEGYGIAVDGSGNAYVTGWTASTNLPTLSPYQATLQGGSMDAFVTKLSADGDILIYSTYLGGGGGDEGYGIAVDGSGNAYVTGWTTSTNFPTLNPYQTNQDTTDAFVTKLSADGDILIYSTYLGGEIDDVGIGIAVDGSGNAYVTGQTYSTNFPTLNPYQTDQVGYDAFVTKLSAAGDSLVYSSYLGGSSNDYGRGIAVDGSGCAYVTGETVSSDFPTHNAYDASFNADYPYFGYDAFVTKFSSTGDSLIYSTYLGGANGDWGNGIAVDGSGNAYVTGVTHSYFNFPTLNAYDASSNGDYDAFVTKFSAVGNALIYSTFLGGGDFDRGYGIAVDGSGNAYVTGYTRSSDFPTQNAYDTTFNDGGDYGDGFVTKLSALADPADVFDDGATIPEGFDLGQNYPNPFNSSTIISFSLDRPSDVDVKIFNLIGQEVRWERFGRKAAGAHQWTWDGCDDQGKALASGVYFYQIKAGGSVISKKMVMLK